MTKTKSGDTYRRLAEKVALLGEELPKQEPPSKPEGRLGLAGRNHLNLPEFIDSFWARVAVNGDCWEWTKATHGKTPITCYGTVWWGGHKFKTHKLSFLLFNGYIPTGMLVCHKCDNPKCVRPSHLFLGTNKDNYIDCARKGRLNREHGEDRYNAKLTEKDVEEIRRKYVKRKYGSIRIASEYGVSQTAVLNVINRLRWKHVN